MTRIVRILPAEHYWPDESGENMPADIPAEIIDARCARCNPCRPEDIDPTTTVYLCPQHEQAHIEFMTRVGFAMIPAPAVPVTWASFRNINHRG